MRNDISSRMDLSSIEDTKKTYGYKPSRCQNCDEYFDPSFLPVHLNNCEQTIQQQMKVKMSLKEDNKMRERKCCKNINILICL